jgi:uncharacterized protein (DUF488 family)
LSAAPLNAEPVPRLWTVGHSTRTEGEFLDLLAEHAIEAVADVRRHPGSRRMPQFGSAALEASLRRRGLAYLWLPGLGGRREPQADSPNTAWRNAAFRGYADYLQTETFAESLIELISLSSGLRTAVMCAEALWWRCHRGLIADVFKWLGFEVIHILGPSSTALHPYTPAASLADGRLSYAAPEQVLLDL